MYRVYKYPIAFEHASEGLDLPAGSRPLSVGVQFNKERGDEDIVLYALVNVEQDTTERHRVHVVGTGHDVPPAVAVMTFLGTVNLNLGQLWFHVFFDPYPTK